MGVIGGPLKAYLPHLGHFSRGIDIGVRHMELWINKSQRPKDDWKLYKVFSQQNVGRKEERLALWSGSVSLHYRQAHQLTLTLTPTGSVGFMPSSSDGMRTSP